MDLIATGKSATMRQMEEQLADLVKNLLSQSPQKQMTIKQLMLRIRQDKDNVLFAFHNRYTILLLSFILSIFLHKHFYLFWLWFILALVIYLIIHPSIYLFICLLFYLILILSILEIKN